MAPTTQTVKSKSTPNLTYRFMKTFIRALLIAIVTLSPLATRGQSPSDNPATSGARSDIDPDRDRDKDKDREHERLERERLEHERLEREKIERERERLEHEKREREKHEHERDKDKDR